jgi:hypothetical protein
MRRVALSVAALTIACSGGPPERSTSEASLDRSLPVDAQLVATIQFTTSTDTSLTVFDDGTVGALIRADGTWSVQRFDRDGMVGETPIDYTGSQQPRWHGNVVVVQDQDKRLCWVVDQEVRAAADCNDLTACQDILVHTETDNGWLVWNQPVPRPSNFDGRVYFPGDSCWATGVVVGTDGPATQLFGADPGVLTRREVSGSWGAISADATHVWLHAIQPDRRTWSVWKVPWVDRGGSLRPITGPELLEWRWRIVELDGEPVEPVAWFQGKDDLVGFDGCTTYVWHNGGVLTDDPACPGSALLPRRGDYRVDDSGSVMRLYSGRITAEPEPLPPPTN